MIKGIVPDFGYDVKLAVVVDNKKQDNVPERGLYKTNVRCNNNATGEWDYNAWNLKLDNVSEGTKCNVTFTSGLTQEEYNNYLDAGIALRRNTYRGKDITNYKSLPEENELNLYNQISSCQFNDIYVGDYIKSNKKSYTGNQINWLIADINNYNVGKCHVTIIPNSSIGIGRMNSEDKTTGGYLNSEMVTSEEKITINGKQYNTLSNILQEYIEPDFPNHIITYHSFLTNQMDEKRSNQFGQSGGASSNWEDVERKVDLMSEVNIFGTTIASSSLYDIGIDNRQYAIFRLNPLLIYEKSGTWYWLKSVTSSTSFAAVNANGTVTTLNSSNVGGGIRPRFLID